MQNEGSHYREVFELIICEEYDLFMTFDGQEGDVDCVGVGNHSVTILLSRCNI